MSSDLTPSTEPSFTSGGTAGILPAERAKATFDVANLAKVLVGKEKGAQIKKDWVADVAAKTQKNLNLDEMDIINQSRTQILKDATAFFIGIHKPYSDKGWTPTRADMDAMRAAHVFGSGMGLNWSMFLNTLRFQASDEQKGWWLDRCLKMKLIGCYAQTELGHGSNVRGIQTTATYDKSTQEFVLNTPTLQATKWWITGLGCVATHALVYAQLIIDGKEHGVHTFMCQVRDHNHHPMPGIEVGDVGNKVGGKSSDTGYLRLQNIRVPREHMLARFQEVTASGEYRKVGIKRGDADPRIGYLTMVATRVGIVAGAGEALASAAVTVMRYSLVRHQGFVDPKPGVASRSPENQVLDYGLQKYRVFKNLSIAYAMKFTGIWMQDFMQSAVKGAAAGSAVNLDVLPELHASSAGLKGVACLIAADAMEDCRKCCGGHGYLLSAGIGHHYQDYLAIPTLEGESNVMALQTSRFLIKSCNDARKGKQLSGLCSYLTPLAGSTTLSDDLLRKVAPQPAQNVEAFFDPAYVIALAQHRTMAAVGQAADLLGRLQAEGMTYQQAWVTAGRELILATRQHVMGFLLKNFKSVVDDITDTPTRKVMTQMMLLFGLTDLQDAPWTGLVEAGLIGSNQQALLQTAIRRLLTQLRPNAVALADAWGISDRVLMSVLGRYDGNVYEALLASARSSELNRKKPFDGYKEYLQPCLDLEFLKHGNKLASQAPKAKL